MLSIQSLTYRIGMRLIFEDASATVQSGWKVGVVGPNGAGKSTLFKLIMKQLEADGGKIEVPDRLTIGWVRQDMPDENQTLLEVVLAADTERTRLLHLVETEQDVNKLGDIYERLLEIDAYAAPARASIILVGLGFKEEQLEQKLADFSGGWRMRVVLAAALFQAPDLLLLDEPTNHLDLEAIMWLENYLATYPHSVLIISHDRDILNKCTDHIIHVENKTLTLYTGNYDTFVKELAERRMNQQKLHERQQAQRAHMQAFVDRFKAKASKAKQAQSRMKALERMALVDAVTDSHAIKFHFPQPEDIGEQLMSINKVDIGYTPGASVLQQVEQRVYADDRIALLGANGNGKSTLMKLLAGKLAPLSGNVDSHPKLRIGYFSQHQEEELDLTDSAYNSMARVMKDKPESQVRAVLGKFGFNKALADAPISTLSGGEKARLLFALTSSDAPHVLLLDEPTNHLDMDTRKALVDALNAYDGAVIIVSHDPSMVEQVADNLWLVADGKVVPFDGDLQAYRGYIVQQRREERRAGKVAATQEPTAETSAKEQKKLLAEKKKRHPHLAEAVREAEKTVNALTKQKARLDAQMAEDGFFADTHTAQDVQFAYGNLLREADEAEDAWLKAQTAFDAAA